jgi:hypothetical protein
MKTRIVSILAIAGWFLAGAAAAKGAETPAAAEAAKQARDTTSAAVTATAKAGATAVSSQAAGQDVQRMQREFDQQSRSVLEKRKTLMERLRKAGTDDERNKIMTELRAQQQEQQQERMDQQRELARQIREQMQSAREARRTQAPGG